MKKVYLVKKDVNKPNGADNWIELNGYEFYQFMQTPEGKARRASFERLDGYGYEDTIIIAECGIEMAKKWRAERRAHEFRESGKREKEYELVSFHALFSDGDINDDEWLADDKNLVEETALKNIQYEDLCRALGELSPVGRQVIVKYYVEDDQEGEIAASLGLSRGEVNNIKRKALRRLRKLLS